MLFVKESVRWLAKKGRHDQALANLIWVRKEDSEAVHAEFAEIIAGIEQEERDTDCEVEEVIDGRQCRVGPRYRTGKSSVGISITRPDLGCEWWGVATRARGDG